MKAIYTAETGPMHFKPGKPEGGPGFWVSIDDESWLPINAPERPIEPGDYDEIAKLFGRRETTKHGKKSFMVPMTFAKRFLHFYEQKPVFHDPIIVEE